MAGYQFIFGGQTGETPESIKRKREIAEALMAYNQPKNAGEGIGAVARGLAAGITNMRANRAEKAGKSAATEALAKLFGGGAASATAPGSTPGNIPMTSAAGEISAGAPGAPIDMDGNQVFDDFMGTVKAAGVDNPNALAAIASTGKAESGFDPKKVNASWSDPSESGQPGMAGGIMSWRADRLNNLKAFAQQNGEDPSNISPSTQAKFFLQEDPNLIASLNAAKSPEEAQQLMNNAWKFAGYDRPGGEAARRIAAANAFVSKFQPDQTQVASLDPGAMMPEQGTPAAAGPQMALAPPTPTPSAAAPQPGYVDPIVSTGNRQQMPMPEAAAMPQQQGPQPPAPALPPPVEVSSPPQVAAIPEQQAPQPRAPSQQVAQALTPPPAETGPTLEQLIQASQQPFLSDGQQRVLNALIQQKGAERSAIREMQIKQADPAYQAELAKTRIELQNLQNPRIAPADQARIDLEKQKQATDQQTNKEKMAFEREKFDAEVQKGQWQKLTDGRLYNQTTGEFKDAPPPLPGSAPVKLDDISGMRKEIQQLPSYKNLAQAAPIYKSMAETAGRNSRASDLNLVYGLGKIMDPTSVVREGEMVMVKNTASLPDWLIGAANSLNGGAALTPETRQAIMTEAYGRMKGYNDEFQQNMGQYQGIVQRNGINPADVIPEIDKFDPWTPPEPPPENPLPPTPGTNKTSTGIPWKVIK